MKFRISIGDVVIVAGEPKDGSAPRMGLMGPERVRALESLALTGFGVEVPRDYSYWHVPFHGASRRITDPDDIDWRTAGVVGSKQLAERQQAADRVKMNRALRVLPGMVLVAVDVWKREPGSFTPRVGALFAELERIAAQAQGGVMDDGA